MATTAIMTASMSATWRTFQSLITKTRCQICCIAEGRPMTMPVKIISDIPLPMPRSVICSPSHMMKAVPVVSVIIVITTKPQPGLITKPPPAVPCPADCSVKAMAMDWKKARITVR